MISHKYKYIFIHIPKTAGTSIKKHLVSLRSPLDHKSPQDPLDYLGHNKLSYFECKYKNIEGFFKFCFIRNPYERMTSLYKYAKNLLKFDLSFLEFCQHVRMGEKFINNVIWEEHYEPQSNYISTKIDFIGKVENINSDFKKICDNLNIPHQELPQINKSNDDLVYVCNNSVQIIEEIYKEDFKYYETKN